MNLFINTNFLRSIYCGMLISGMSFMCQAANIDSLYRELKFAKTDTQEVTIRIALIEKLIRKDSLAAFKIMEPLMKKIDREPIGEHKYKSIANLGYALLSSFHTQKGKAFFEKGLRLAKLNNDQKWKSKFYLLLSKVGLRTHSPSYIILYIDSALGSYPASGDLMEANMLSEKGRAYYDLGDYKNAMRNYIKSQEIFESKKIENSDYGVLLHFIGSVYKRQNNDAKALEYYDRMISLGKKHNLPKIEAEGLYLAADLVGIAGDYEKDLDYLNKALEIYERIHDYDSQTLILLNIAHNQIRQKEYDIALSYINRSQAIGKRYGIDANDYIIQKYLGKIYLKKGKIKESLNYYKKAFEIAQSREEKRLLNSADVMRAIAFAQYEAGNYKQAFDDYDTYQYYNDSLINENNSNIVHDLEEKYQSEKRDSEIKLLNVDKANQQIIIKQQKQQRIGLAIGILVLILFLILVYNRYKLTLAQRNIIEIQNAEVTLQKNIVEEKNRQILESISCALRIQNAILPTNRIVKQYLANSFILYMPKDIIAGDFYWMETMEAAVINSNEHLGGEMPTANQELVLFAACDCTGHGVSGAMVSVMCKNALNRAVREFGLTKPSEILTKVSEIVVENFSKGEGDISDGMDASLCVYDPQSNTLNWAGANNPLWIVRNGELIETKGDKQPVGKYEDFKPFTNHEFKLEKGDSIYVFSDGYADQFGGKNRDRKLTRKGFKQLILSMQTTPIFEQGKALEKFIVEYSNGEDQVDDILVMGVQI